ncbi:MAG: PilZ domain-containing protein [Acidobacteriia bacterium]|nr:PilZ domain-containing protein [Terriglobia bacterium]
MTKDSERREARRFTMALPMRILPQEAVDCEFQGQTRDVSYRGLYFLADTQKFAVGSEIEFIITLPQQVRQSGNVHIRCRGQIVRVEDVSNRKGVAAKIDRYEFLPVT